MERDPNGMSEQIEKERERIQAEMENFRKKHEKSLKQFYFEEETYRKAWGAFQKDFPDKNSDSASSLKVRRIKHELEVLQKQLEQDLDLYQKKYRELVRLAESGEIQ